MVLVAAVVVFCTTPFVPRRAPVVSLHAGGRAGGRGDVCRSSRALFSRRLSFSVAECSLHAAARSLAFSPSTHTHAYKHTHLLFHLFPHVLIELLVVSFVRLVIFTLCSLQSRPAASGWHCRPPHSCLTPRLPSLLVLQQNNNKKMENGIDVIITVLLSLTAALSVMLVLLLCKYRMQILRLQKFRLLLHRSPPADPCPQPVTSPVVDALVVFPGQQEALRQMEECDAPLTRIHSELPAAHDVSSRSPFDDDSGDGNRIPHAQPEVLHGVPIDHRRCLIPAVNASDCEAKRPTGVLYRLRPASTVYGGAEYITRDRSHSPRGDATDN